MNESLVADIWTLLVEHIPEKYRNDAASEYINTLLDHGIKEGVLNGLLGIDPYLDEAITYAIDGEEIEDEYDDYQEDEE